MLHALLHIPPAALSRAPHKVASVLITEATKPTFSPKERIFNWYADLDRHHKALHRRINHLLTTHRRMEGLFKAILNKKGS